MDRNCLRNYDKTRKVHDWFRYFAPVFITFSVALGFITRILLLFTPPTVIGFTALEWLKIFLLGFVNDVAFSLLALAPLPHYRSRPARLRGIVIAAIQHIRWIWCRRSGDSPSALPPASRRVLPEAVRPDQQEGLVRGRTAVHYGAVHIPDDSERHL